MSSTDTIVALSSGALPSGVAVLRISGPAAGQALSHLAGGKPEPRRASLRRIRDASGEIIDRGLVLFFPGPSSVTGEDLAEIHLHGGRAVVSASLAALTALPGLRLAEAGEFTRRAFENGRIDLTEAEGLADLLAAETQAQHRQAVRQAGGALRDLAEGWMRRLTKARALLEADFDFADEGDVGEGVAGGVAASVRRLSSEMRAHLAGAHRGEILREGFRVAIAGAPNAGKSSLLNALASREVAIVSDSPGTTRDVLEVRLDLAGVPVLLSDTAGLRESEDEIEAIGVARAKETMRRADLVLFLVDPATIASHVKRGEDESGLAPILRLATKSDRWAGDPAAAAPEGFDMAISSRSGAGLEALVRELATRAAKAAGDPAAVLPMRVRHREIIEGTLAVLEGVDLDALPPEIAAETLRHASDRLGALTGRTGVEDLLDIIFSEFCIGK